MFDVARPRVLGASTCQLTAPSALLVLGVRPHGRHALCRVVRSLQNELTPLTCVLASGTLRVLPLVSAAGQLYTAKLHG